jgi:hypothetical protein
MIVCETGSQSWYTGTMESSKKRTALTVGSTLYLTGSSNLRAHAADDAPVVGHLNKGRTKVLKITFNRTGCKLGSVWIEVCSVTDPTQRGWTRFDCGTPEGMVLAIEKLVFTPREGAVGTDIRIV